MFKRFTGEMFTRFTGEAGEVVVEARNHAVRLGDDHIGTEHLLLALLTAPSTVKVLLEDFGLNAEGIESERVEFVGSNNPVESGRGPLAAVGIELDFGLNAEGIESERVEFVGSNDPLESDRDALAALGIDLEQVEATIDSAFGVGALEQARRNRDRMRRWRRRSRQPRRAVPLGGSDRIPFSPRSKNVLELSLREALRLKHNFTGPEHLALGMLREGEGLACHILIRNGITLEGLRTSLEDMLRRAA